MQNQDLKILEMGDIVKGAGTSLDYLDLDFVEGEDTPPSPPVFPEKKVNKTGPVRRKSSAIISTVLGEVEDVETQELREMLKESFGKEIVFISFPTDAFKTSEKDGPKLLVELERHIKMFQESAIFRDDIAGISYYGDKQMLVIDFHNGKDGLPLFIHQFSINEEIVKLWSPSISSYKLVSRSSTFKVEELSRAAASTDDLICNTGKIGLFLGILIYLVQLMLLIAIYIEIPNRHGVPPLKSRVVYPPMSVVVCLIVVKELSTTTRRYLDYYARKTNIILGLCIGGVVTGSIIMVLASPFLVIGFIAFIIYKIGTTLGYSCFPIFCGTYFAGKGSNKEGTTSKEEATSQSKVERGEGSKSLSNRGRTFSLEDSKAIIPIITKNVPKRLTSFSNEEPKQVSSSSGDKRSHGELAIVFLDIALSYFILLDSLWIIKNENSVLSIMYNFSGVLAVLSFDELFILLYTYPLKELTVYCPSDINFDGEIAPVAVLLSILFYSFLRFYVSHAS
jgi:hypothetical protein